MPTTLPVPASVDLDCDSAKRLPKPRASEARRRSSDVCDEMRLFDSRGTREQPPTHRVSGRAKQTHEQTNSASQESEAPSSRVVGRARGDSLAEDPSAHWLAIRSPDLAEDHTDLQV
jgi:hypothetical protein